MLYPIFILIKIKTQRSFLVDRPCSQTYTDLEYKYYETGIVFASQFP